MGPLQAGASVTIWLRDTTPAGVSMWVGVVTDDRFPDGHVGVMLNGTGGVIAKVPPTQVIGYAPVV